MENADVRYHREGRSATITLNNQLMMQKLMINQAYDNKGLQTTQMFATLFDGITRHSPEGTWFKKRADEVGFKQAVQERDRGAPIADGVSTPLSPYKKTGD